MLVIPLSLGIAIYKHLHFYRALIIDNASVWLGLAMPNDKDYASMVLFKAILMVR